MCEQTEKPVSTIGFDTTSEDDILKKELEETKLALDEAKHYCDEYRKDADHWEGVSFWAILFGILFLFASVVLGVCWYSNSKDLKYQLDDLSKQTNDNSFGVYNELCGEERENQIIAKACEALSYNNIIVNKDDCKLTLVYIACNADATIWKYKYIMRAGDIKYKIEVSLDNDGHIHFVDITGWEKSNITSFEDEGVK